MVLQVSWERFDSNGDELREGDLCVGDSGRVYRIVGEQYSTGGGFIRVNFVEMQRGRWVCGEEIRGQTARCVVRITPEELEEFAHTDRKFAKRGLMRYYTEHRASQREEFSDRQRMIKGLPKRLVSVKEKKRDNSDDTQETG